MRSTLRDAADLYIARIGLIASIALTVQIPVSALSNWVVLRSGLPQDFGLVSGWDRPFWLDAPLGVMEAVAWALGYGALIHAFDRINRGEQPAYTECMAAGARSFWRMLAVHIVVTAAVLVGLIALIVPGVILLVRYTFAIFPVALEEAGPFRALEISARLTKGRRWRLLGIIALLGGLSYALSAVIHVRVAALHSLRTADVSTYLAHTLADGVGAVLCMYGGAVLFVMYSQAKIAPERAGAADRPEPETASTKAPGETSGAGASA